MTVITMTREMGSLGNRVAQEVCKRLKLRLVYQELVESVAEKMQLRPSTVGRFVEGESSFIENFFLDSRGLGLCTAAELLEHAHAGDLLIRGWGGSHVLRDIPHVLHVRVCAPMTQRIANMRSRMESLDAGDWLREIEASDRQHSEVIERMYGSNGWQDPKHYHLVLDTSETSVEECTERVIEMAGRPQFRPTEESMRILADCLLAARVKSCLQSSPRLRDSRLEVTSRAGAVILDGIVEDDARRDGAGRAAAGVPGVHAMENRIRVMREAAHYMAE